MTDKINVEAILQQYTLLQTQFRANPILEDNTKAAIKEIVEAVIDKCAERAKTKKDFDFAGEKPDRIIDKQSILNIKKEIEYE